MPTPPRSRSSAFALAVVAAAIVTSILPAFLLGSLSVRIRAELGYGETVAGVVFSAFFAASAVVSSRLGRWVDEVGPRLGLSVALAGTVAIQFGIALAVRGVVLLAVLAALGGVCNAVSQLSANVFIARRLPLHRQGIGFAVKQSAMPGAALVAGLALPSIALTLGWRWVFAAGACCSAAALVGVRTTLGADVRTSERSATGEAPTQPPPMGALAVLAVAAALATGAAVTLGGFFVESSIDAGVDVAVAGAAFAAGSLVSIVVRLVVGAAADRRPGNLLGVVAVMIALGAAMSVLFTWRSPVVHLVGVPLAFGAGWAWPGLFNLSVVRACPQAPGRATGVTQTGTYVGGAVGPVLFGAVAEAVDYRAAWWVAAALGLAAATAVLVGRARLGGPDALRWSDRRRPSTRP